MKRNLVNLIFRLSHQLNSVHAKTNVLASTFLSRYFVQHCTKKKFSMKIFFSKCDQIRRKRRSWSHLLKKFVMENFILCGVKKMIWLLFGRGSPQWNDYCSVLVFFNLRSIKLVKILFNWRIYSLILQVLLVLLTLYFAMSCICCSIFKVCLTILRHFEVKGFNIVII